MYRLTVICCCMLATTGCISPQTQPVATQDSLVVADAYNNDDDDDNIIVCHFPLQPFFPGGDDSLYAFLKRNLQYPKVAALLQKQGTVFLQFTVDPSGKLSDFRTGIRQVGFGMEEEALRVGRLMPDWEWPAADSSEKRQTVYMNLPIRFVLE